MEDESLLENIQKNEDIEVPSFNVTNDIVVDDTLVEDTEIHYAHDEVVDEVVHEEELNENHQRTCNERTPTIGMTFNTYEEVFEFYNSYARSVGFGILKRRTSCGNEGRVKAFTLACSKSGKFRPLEEKSFMGRPSQKTNCKAMVNAVFRYGLFHLSKVLLDHNHELNPSMSGFFRCNNKLDTQVKIRVELNDRAGISVNKNYNTFVVEAGGYETLTFGEKECRKYIDEVRWLRLGEGDTEALCSFFKRMCKQNLSFFYSIKKDEDGHLKSVFWANARSRATYESFGDVIYFDTTYLKNAYDMPFAPIVGINHHCQSVLLGCGLLSNDTTESYIWLFKAWLECMSGRPPSAIVTDQCKAVRGAVAEVFPNACHRLSIWHIMEKVPEKLGAYKEFEEISQRMHKVVYESLRPDQFEEEWRELIEEYQLQENEWLKSLYEDRYIWVPVYFKGTFWAGMSSTQSSESMKSFFGDYIHSKTTLKQFIEQYDNALQSKYEKEASADFNSFHKSLQLFSSLYMEKQLWELYTNDVFKKFQDEIRDLMYCNVTLAHMDGPISTFDVCDIVKPEDHLGKTRKRIKYQVLFNEDELEVRCICLCFEFRGILCRHAVSVLLIKGINEIPPRYILERWRKDIKRPHNFVNSSYDDMGDPDQVDRYNKLRTQCLQLVDLGSTSIDNYMWVLKVIGEAKEKLIKEQSISVSNNAYDMNKRGENDENTSVGEPGDNPLNPLHVKRKVRPQSQSKSRMCKK